MEKIFKLKENGTTVRTEILAGLTTFMTMAYIIALNPNLLTGFAVGTPLWNGVFLATCIASAIGTACMAFLANKPFAMAPQSHRGKRRQGQLFRTPPRRYGGDRRCDRIRHYRRGLPHR